MPAAMICSKCGKTYASQAEGTQALSGTEYDVEDKDQYEANRGYHAVSFDLCTDCVVKPNES